MLFDEGTAELCAKSIMSSPASAHSSRPTHARYWIFVFAVTLAVITYVDRVCISLPKKQIQSDLGIDDAQMGWVFFSFSLAYAIFELPCGWMGDKWGPRVVLMRVVSWWSVFTALTGTATGYASMLAYRFLFGAGEAGAFPNLTKTYTIWLRKRERTLAQAVTWLSARWAGALTPLLVAFVLNYLTWRQCFFLFGSLGVVWVFFFSRWFRDNPADHPSVNAAELALLEDAHTNAASHGDVPWGRFAGSPSVWFLCLQYFCMSYAWYFYITWLPSYLQEARGLTFGKSALLAGLPLFAGGLGNLAAGGLTSLLSGTLGLDVTRRAIGFVGLAVAGVMLWFSARLQSAESAMFAMAMASFCNDMAMPGAWGACMDKGGKYAGTLSGTMNMIGNLGGAFGPMITGLILKYSTAGMAPGEKNWVLAITVGAVVYVVGAVCWLFIDTLKPLDQK